MRGYQLPQWDCCTELVLSRLTMLCLMQCTVGSKWVRWRDPLTLHHRVVCYLLCGSESGFVVSARSREILRLNVPHSAWYASLALTVAVMHYLRLYVIYIGCVDPLSIGTSGGPSWTRQWTFWFHKRWGISWLSEQLLASQEELCSTELLLLLWLSLFS
jgi:hypothetical protein